MGARGVLAIVGRGGRRPVLGAPPQGTRLPDPGAELARRFLGAYAPARPRLLAGWAGIATSHAEALWARAGDLARVDLDGTAAWALAGDAGALAAPPAAEGVRLLPNLDPLAAGRDRELLVPDAALRTRIWPAIGGPGLVLDGEVAGLWRTAKTGRRLVVTVEPLGEMGRGARDALAAEAARLAPFRGAETAELAWSSREGPARPGRRRPGRPGRTPR